ncbi:MAG: hypothetical protein IJP91_05780 [Synergistaceae bacterium]|nr:hypothetical protein [Synergistaceae bacterium]
MFTRELTVQPSDVSCRGSIKLKSLLDYFQDTAGLAVENIEGTTTELIARGYAWVLTRYEIEIVGRLPSLDEKFLINTFHDPSHGYNTLRVFDVRTQDGTPIAWAKSSWLLLDLATGRPVKPAAHLPEILKRDTAEISPDFQAVEDDGEKILRRVEFPVRFHDLDYNAHVNNAVYFSWVFDECPVDFAAHELKSIRASFRSGAKFGEKVTLEYSEAGENIFSCRIIRENVTKPSANFILEWQAIQN